MLFLREETETCALQTKDVTRVRAPLTAAQIIKNRRMDTIVYFRVQSQRITVDVVTECE